MPRAAASSLVASLLLHAALPLSAAFEPPPRRFLPASLVELDLVPALRAPSALGAPTDVSAPALDAPSSTLALSAAAVPRVPDAVPRRAANSAAVHRAALNPPALHSAALHSAALHSEATNPAPLAARADQTASAAAGISESLAPSSAASVPAVGSAIAAGSANGALALTAMPGAGSGLGSPQVDAERARYMRALRARVVAHREYSYLARRAGLEGTVCLRVSVTAAGEVSELHATCGAPASALLDSALHAVRAAAPFGALPPVLGSALTVDVPIVFQLDAASAGD